MEERQGVRFGQMERAILSEAGKLFAENGFNQTSLQDIANALGMARPSLYYYFNNREQILAAGVSEITQQREQLLEELATTRGNPAERLEVLVLGLGRFMRQNSLWIRVLLRDEVALPEEIRTEERRSRLAYFDFLVDVLSEGIREGYARALDERATALTIVAALAGLQGNYAATSHASSGDVTQLAVEIILHGVLDDDRQPETQLHRGLKMITDGVALVRRSTRNATAEEALVGDD